jgi:PAS domain S-box-containing protein
VGSVLDAVPGNVALLAHDGTIVGVNRAWLEFARKNGLPPEAYPTTGLGADYLSIAAGATGADADLAAQAHRGLVDIIRGDRDSLVLDYPCHSPDQERYFRLMARPLPLPDGRGVLVQHLDVTTETQAQRGREELSRHLRSFFNQSLVGMAFTRPDTTWGRVNQALASMLGYSPAELADLSWLEMTHPEDRPTSLENYESVASGGAEACIFRKRYLCRSGRVVHAIVAAHPIFDDAGQVELFCTLVLDVTDQVRTEQRLRRQQELLRGLTLRLASTETRERQELAARLHDTIAQTLGTANLKLARLMRRLQGETEAGMAADVQQLIRDASREARSAMFDLDPPLLQDLDFDAAMSWLAQDCAERLGLKVAYESSARGATIDIGHRRLLYQCAQELLTNVARHSGVHTARVWRGSERQHVVLRVIDEGQGFDPDAVHPETDDLTRFGLYSLRERVDAAGGRLLVDSAPGEGTRVTVMLPEEERDG